MPLDSSPALGFSDSRKYPQWPSPRNNGVLASLPDHDIERLHGLMQRVLLKRDQVLHEIGQRVETAYFLCEGLVSLTLNCQQGVDFELGLVGREGVVGEREVLADGVAVVRSQVQLAGSAYVLPMDILKAEFRRSGPLRDAILRQVHARLVETSQVALCNHLHGMEEKSCRWLLTIYDRAQTSDLPLTQEFIARMLATRRSGVTIAAGTLRKSGLIDYSRGNIKILNPQGLERSACECYRVIKASQEPRKKNGTTRRQKKGPLALYHWFGSVSCTGCGGLLLLPDKWRARRVAYPKSRS